MENLNAEQVISELRKNDSCYVEDIKAIRNAIALINSQEQRIEELGEENERLTSSIKILVNNNADLEFELAQTYDLLEESKADTVRKMQELIYERLDISVEGYSSEEIKSDVRDMVYQIAKEMLEGKNET